MDFNLDEDLQEVAGLAEQILADKADTDRVRAVEATESRVDEALWDELGRAGLIGIALPEELGGAGLGVGALAAVLEQQGRHVAPVPLWSACVGAMAIAHRGTDAQRAALFPALADGTERVTLALEEYDGAEPTAPRCVATPAGDGWTLTGVKAVVPTPQGADHVLVSATAPEGAGLFLVAADAAGISWETTPVTTHDLAGELTLADTPAQLVGDLDATLPHVLRVAAVAIAAVQLGVTQGALALAASYSSGREQFGRPLGTFQALQHQLADCWIDIDAMRVTLWQAIEDLQEGSPNAARSALVAKWWCDQAGLDVVHRVQHVHGGIGVDVDYPVHRNFLWGKQLSSTLGGSSAALADLGDLVATEEVAS